MSKRLFDNLVEAEKLPLGHVKRKKAKEVLARVYRKSAEVEKKWRKRFGKKRPRFDSAKQALDFCNLICEIAGEQKLRGIVLDSKDVHPGSGGHCNIRKKEIHFPSKWFSFESLIHELTHHFGPCLHDDDFCEMEDLLFEIVYTEILGKKMKKDW